MDHEPTPAPLVVARTPLGLFAATYAFVSLVAFSPVVNFQAWTPKAALLPMLIAVGIPVWVSLVREGEHRLVATLGGVFVAVAAVSTIFSTHRSIALFGLYGWGTGLVFCIALVCAWAIGRVLDERGRTDLGHALLAGAAVNLLVAVAQRLFDVSSFRLEMSFGRSSGLLGNPVNLTALAVAALAWVVVARASSKPGAWLVSTAATGALVHLAGGRIGYMIAVGLVIWVLRRHGLRVALLAFAAIAVGIGMATPVAEQSGMSPGERVGASVSGQGVASRIENWATTRHAVVEAPLVGSGPGTYFAATGKHRTSRLGRLDGGDNVYADAHNFAVEYLVTTGVLGAAALGAFVVFALRGARGPWLAVAVALFVSHLVQPQNVAITPLMFLALGASRPQGEPLRLPPLLRPLWLAGGVTAIAVTAILLYGDHELRQSDLDFTVSQARAAERVLPRWKDPAALLSRNYLFLAIEGGDIEEYYDEAERWRRISIAREPFDASSWYRLGDLQLRRNKIREAEHSFRQALEVNPTSVYARVGLGHIALLRGDRPGAHRWWEEALPLINNPATAAEIRQLMDRTG